MANEVTQIKERLAIADVIGEYVQLKRTGASFKGLCPFHQEKTPSFVVTPERHMWHCFGCGEGGDVFSFVQRVEGLDFKGALRLLAPRAGVVLQGKTFIPRREERDEQERIREVVVLTTRFYQEILLRHASGAQARDYLTQRGVTAKSMEQFQLGYAPDRWDALQQFLVKRGATVADMMAAGVVGKSERGTLYDRFRGRIIFPIHDVQGRAVALAGRIVPWQETGKEGKYVNSPETSLYRKRQVVYNMHRAKQAIRENKRAVVVEGYMDVILLAQQGFSYVVASSGTAFTPEHIQLLSRFTRTLHFAFDADAAGWHAALRATDSALSFGMRVGVLTFPPGKDPADVAKEQPKELATYVDHPVSLMRVALDQLQGARGEAVEARLQEVIPLLHAVQNPVQQGEMIQEVAGDLHVPEERVVQLMARAARPSLSRQETTSSVFHRLSPDQQLLGLLMAHPQARQDFFPQLKLEFFVDEPARVLYKVLQRIANSHDNFFAMVAEDLLRIIPAEHITFAVAVHSVSCDHIEPEQRYDEARELMRWLTRRALRIQRDQLQRQLASVSTNERVEVAKKFQGILEQLENVG